VPIRKRCPKTKSKRFTDDHHQELFGSKTGTLKLFAFLIHTARQANPKERTSSITNRKGDPKWPALWTYRTWARTI
jgi:hypothetical protein